MTGTNERNRLLGPLWVHCRRIRQQVKDVKNMDLNRATQNWNMKCVSPRSALRVFTSSERLGNQLKTNEIGEVGKLVTKIEMDGGNTVGELVRKIQMNELKSWRSVRFGQEEYMKPEQDAMLAEADEEDGFIKSLNNITREEFPGKPCRKQGKKS